MALDLSIPQHPSKFTPPTTGQFRKGDRYGHSQSSQLGSGPSSPVSTGAESFKGSHAPSSTLAHEPSIMNESRSTMDIFGQDANPQSRAGDAPGVINEAGHVQEVERNFSLMSICSVGVVIGSTWPALGGSIAVAISNGGPPGVLYEFILVSIFYWLVAASLAELASSMPSSAGVYHWASITPGPKWGRVCGWFAGWWNFLAWLFASASIASIVANICVAMYTVYHPGFVSQAWHVFVAYIIITWLCCGIVLFANRALPAINNLGLTFILIGVLVTILVCAILPGRESHMPHSSSSFVWADFVNATGWDSNGFVFLAGMLNGAFAVGTPDCVSHLAEEIPRPRRNVPLAIAAQMSIGFVTALCYLIAIFYAINNLDAVTDSDGTFSRFPLAEIYSQATSTKAGTLGLLLLILLPLICTCVGTFITAGRTLWTLSRDDASPFSSTFGQIAPGQNFKNPFSATLACGCLSTLLGCIYVGSTTAFNAFVGSFVILSTLSYCAAILPFVITGRFRKSRELGGNGMRQGPFAMGHKTGMMVNITSCAYIIVFLVIYCFPFVQPVTASNMNYASLTTGGLTIFIALWWSIRGRGSRYVGPKPMLHREDEAYGGLADNPEVVGEGKA